MCTLYKSCQKTTTLARGQPSQNRSHGYSFSKVGQTSRLKSRGQKLRYNVKGLVTRNTHVQYESPISLLVRKLWPMLKFFKRRSNFKVTRFNLAFQAFQTKVHLLMASLQYDSNSRPSDHNSCPLPIHVMSHAAGFPSSSLFVCLLATIHFSILFLCHAMSRFNEICT